MARNSLDTRWTAGVSLMALLALACPSAAVAQPVDYTALERLLGEPITTSVTGKPERSSEAPANLEIITADMIRQAGITTVADLPRVLKMLSGVDVQQHSLNVYNVGIHGYGGPLSSRILVLVNGRQVYLDHFGYTQWGTIPVEIAEIRQVEVIKGPNAALFGFNAVNGVINIVTYSALTDTVREAVVTAGTFDYYGGSATLSGRVAENVGIRVAAGGFRADSFDDRDDPLFLDARTRPERTSASLNVLARTGPSTEVGLELTRSTMMGREFIIGYVPVRSDYMTWSAKTRISSDTAIGLLDAQLYHNGSELMFPDRTTGQSAVFFNDVTVAQASLQFKLGTDHSFRPAVEYRRNTMNTPPIYGAEVGYDVYSAALMWHWQVSDVLTFTNSVRLDQLELFRNGTVPPALRLTNDDWDVGKTAFNFNSGLVWLATEVDSVRLTVGQANQAPSLTEFGYLDIDLVPSGTPFGDIQFVNAGDPKIEPTEVLSAQIGWDRALPDLNMRLRSAVFYQRSEDIKGSDPYGSIFFDPFSLVVRFDNQGGSEEWGAEIGLESTRGASFRWGVNYAYALLKDDPDDGNYVSNQPGVPSGFLTEEDATPRHRVNARIGVTIDGWELDGWGHYVSRIFQERPFQPAMEVPDYFQFNARVAYTIADTFTLSLVGTNINRGNTRQDIGPGIEREVRATLSARF